MSSEQHEEEYFDEPENLAVHTVLHNKWTFWYLKRSQAKAATVAYDENVIRISSFQTVEHFFRVYDHLVKPNDIKSIDYHLFKNNIKPAWEDENNKDGGKWMVRLKKGLASFYWEELVFALIGEQFDVGAEICGAVISMRSQEDVISVWNRSADNAEATSRIKEQLRKILKLPTFISVEYRRHTPSGPVANTNEKPTAASSQPQQQSRETPRQSWAPREGSSTNSNTNSSTTSAGKEYHAKEARTYVRSDRSESQSTRQKPSDFPVPSRQSNPAWKPMRPAPVNSGSGDPVRDKETHEGGGWVKSMKDGTKVEAAASVEVGKPEQPPAAWGSPKEQSSAWRGKTEKKPPGVAETSKTWSRGKVADTTGAADE